MIFINEFFTSRKKNPSSTKCAKEGTAKLGSSVEFFRSLCSQILLIWESHRNTVAATFILYSYALQGCSGDTLSWKCSETVTLFQASALAWHMVQSEGNAQVLISLYSIFGTQGSAHAFSYSYGAQILLIGTNELNLCICRDMAHMYYMSESFL